jgi:maltose O-acetyltransferase
MTASYSNPLKAIAVALAFQGYNSVFTHLPFNFLRLLYLTVILRIRVGKGTFIGMGCFVTGRLIEIGAHTAINRDCHLDGRGGLRIGDNVSISPECYLLSLTHDVNSPGFNAVPKPASLGNRVWLGARALVLPGVAMGEGAVAGAGAVVAKSCGAFEIVAGVPATKIGERSRDLRYALDYFPLFNTDVQL